MGKGHHGQEMPPLDLKVCHIYGQIDLIRGDAAGVRGSNCCPSLSVLPKSSLEFICGSDGGHELSRDLGTPGL